MSVSFTTTPAFPVLKTGAELTFSLSAGGNFVRLWCTDAPAGSKLATELADVLASSPSASPRVALFEGDATPHSAPFLFQPDKPGRYQLTAQEYIRGASSYGGGYSGDPAGFNSEKKPTGVGEDSLTIDFGERGTFQMGVAPDTATLVVYVFGDDIQATTFELHGENSPAIVDTKTEKARNAATLLNPIAQAFAGLPAATILGNVQTVIVGMINKIAGHVGLTAGSVHAAADTYNVPNGAYAFATSPELVIKGVSEIITALRLHMTTDQARRTPFVSSGVGTGIWHNPSGGAVVADGHNQILSPAPTTIGGAYAALGDIWQAYEAHRIDLSVHGAVDSTYPMTALPKLMDLHREFFELVLLAASTIAPNENPGVQVLVSGAGMKTG